MRFYLLTGTLLLTSAISSGTTVVNFNVVGDTTLPSFSQSGVTVTGSGDLRFSSGLAGVGVVGGQFDEMADNGEYLDFAFGQPVVDLGYSVLTSSGSGFLLVQFMNTGLRTVTVFGEAGTLLGQYFDLSVNPLFSVSSHFPEPITRIRLTAESQMGFAANSIQFTAVPEPATLGYVAGGLVTLWGLVALLRSFHRS